MNKCTARKVALIFTLSMILTYFLLLGVFGEEGLLHARSMRRELQILRQRQDVLLLQVDSLEQQEQLMSSQDALKDAAFRFGYQVEGEQVYYFADEEESDHVRQAEDSFSQTKTQPYPGFSKPWVALMALAFSSLFTLLWCIGAKRRERFR